MKILEGIAQSIGRGTGTEKSSLLQLNAMPVTLDPDHYANARSSANPNGDLRPLFAFRQLVDAVPEVSRSYRSSGRSTETTYELVINGASAVAGADFAAGVIASAKKDFESHKFQNMDGTVGDWRPVYAAPEDWYDTSKPGRFKDLTINLTNPPGSTGRFAVIGGLDRLKWRVSGDGTGTSSSVDAKTKIRSISLKYQLVQLQRPWFSATLFDTAHWQLGAQRAGFCSSGSLKDNQGVLPLLPTAMLIGTDASLDADLSAADKKLKDTAESEAQGLFLGPFLVDAPEKARASLQVIGWVSSVVPFSPQIGAADQGSITVKNDSARSARFSVSWTEGQERTERDSGTIDVDSSTKISIPGTASNISVKIEMQTFRRRVEAWKAVATYQFDSPVTKRYELTGTARNATVTEQ